MSVHNTNLRYELVRKNNSQEFLKKQKMRIKDDETYVEDLKGLQREETRHLRSIWEETLEMKLGFMQAKEQQNKMQDGEARLTGKANLAVRREALKQLLEKEHSTHVKELRAIGKAFHKERI